MHSLSTLAQVVRLAHISDLHFSSLRWKFSHLCSKRWLGYCNVVFKRHKEYATDHLSHLVEIFLEHQISHVLITGDTTSIASKEEFENALAWVQQLEMKGLQVFVIPGNHDHYIRHPKQHETFYHFFGKYFSSDLPFTLQEEGVAASKLTPSWWVVGLDTALPTSLISSCGLFSERVEKNLERLLQEIPSSDSILLMNHYPFFHHESPRKILYRGKELQHLIQAHPNIHLYLHGHTHRHTLADLRPSFLPIILDSGSIAHKTRPSWNLIELKDKAGTIQTFFHNSQGWKKEKELPFFLQQEIQR